MVIAMASVIAASRLKVVNDFLKATGIPRENFLLLSGEVNPVSPRYYHAMVVYFPPGEQKGRIIHEQWYEPKEAGPKVHLDFCQLWFPEGPVFERDAFLS